MIRPRGLFVLAIALLLVPPGPTIASARASGPQTLHPEPQSPGAPQDAERPKPAAEPAPRIKGKTVDEWRAALKDRDADVRLKAVEILGERAFDPAVPARERDTLMVDVTSMLHSDRDAEVRAAAAFFSDLRRVRNTPEQVKQALEQWKRAIRPTSTPIRLIDTQGRPIAGAAASSFFFRDADHDPAFITSEPASTPRSNARGEVTVKLDVPSHRDAAAVYALRQDDQGTLVGTRWISPEEIRQGRPIEIVMHPACRVRLRLECPGFRELAEKYHAEIGGDGWWRAAYVWLGENTRAPRPLFTSSSRGELEFFLPPGRYMIMAYGTDATSITRMIEVKPGHRVLSLGVLDVEPSDEIKQGHLRGYWRSVRRDPQADRKDETDERRVSFRRPRSGVILKGENRQATGLAYAPDGKLLASAHSPHPDPAEVKLWDVTTGGLLAAFPLADRSVGAVAFSPDGRYLAAHATGQSDRSVSEIVLWDTTSRRELRRLSAGSAGWIMGLAFAPDSKSLATIGSDKAVRFWDVATGRETSGTDAIGAGRRLAFSPDGRTLAFNGASGALVLWDIAGKRVRAELEPPAERFRAHALAFAPDGRTLAAAGTVPAPGGNGHIGRVRLYDLTSQPPARRAELTHEPEGRVERAPWASDIAFTPDGRRLIGLSIGTLGVWDVATGLERDSIERGTGSSADCLAISPDGRWLAATQPVGAGITLLDLKPIDD